MVARETYHTTPEGWIQVVEKLVKAGHQILGCNEPPSHLGFVDIADNGSILAGHYLSMSLCREGFDKEVLPEGLKSPEWRKHFFGFGPAPERKRVGSSGQGKKR